VAEEGERSTDTIFRIDRGGFWRRGRRHGVGDVGDEALERGLAGARSAGEE
jgi:hypothetical protein